MIAWITEHKALFIAILGYLVAFLNGILPYVPTGKAGTLLGKAFVALRWILDLVAPSTAKNSPGSVKMPLTWSQPPK